MRRNSINAALDSAAGNFGSVRTGVGLARTTFLSRERTGLIVIGIMVLFWLSSDDISQDPIPMRWARGEAGAMTLGITISPDGKTIATVDSAGRVAIWDKEDDWRISRFLDYGGLAWSVAFSPDGRFLAVGGGDTAILVFDLSTGAAPRALNPPVGSDHGFGVLT